MSTQQPQPDPTRYLRRRLAALFVLISSVILFLFNNCASDVDFSKKDKKIIEASAGPSDPIHSSDTGNR